MGDNYVWTQKWSHMRVDACHLKRKSKSENRLSMTRPKHEYKRGKGLKFWWHETGNTKLGSTEMDVQNPLHQNDNE